jgi:hypothetical protein
MFMHYALDLWFEKVVRPRCRADAYLSNALRPEDLTPCREFLSSNLLKAGIVVADGCDHVLSA